MTIIERVKKYSKVFSVSGAESTLREMISQDIAPICETIHTDDMGNLIGHVRGTSDGKKLMVAAHMDEIGYVVTGIEESGLIRVHNIGGINLAASSHHEIIFGNGTRGVLAFDENITLGDLSAKHMYIDIGAKTKKQAAKKVEIGDLCHIVPSFVSLMNGRYAIKALDDRIGCAVSVHAALEAKSFAHDTYICFTVQEEIGLRGASPVSFGIEPDYSLAVDISVCSDVPGTKHSRNTLLGGGAVIKMMDAGMISSPVITRALSDYAVEAKIPVQKDIYPFIRSDASAMQVSGRGCHAGEIAVPIRYYHTPIEMMDIKDAEAAAGLLRCCFEKGFCS